MQPAPDENDGYAAIVASARAQIADGVEPDWRALQERIETSSRRGRSPAAEKALRQLERLRAVQRARALVDREPAQRPEPPTPTRPARRASFRTRPTITGNMDVRRTGDRQTAAITWDGAAGVTGWDVRVSRRSSARAAYAVEDERTLPASETMVGLPLTELPIRVHVLGRGASGQLIRRALISGLTEDNWSERWQRRATAS